MADKKTQVALIALGLAALMGFGLMVFFLAEGVSAGMLLAITVGVVPLLLIGFFAFWLVQRNQQEAEKAKRKGDIDMLDIIDRVVDDMSPVEARYAYRQIVQRRADGDPSLEDLLHHHDADAPQETARRR
jgi:hypothetical protein